MTSRDVPAFLRDLAFADGVGVAGAVEATSAFVRDYDSDLAFPDLPYDPAAPTSRYRDDARPTIDAIVDEAMRLLAGRVPRARAFVDDAVDRVMLRRSTAVAGATSASNRACVGACVVTNVEAAAEPVLVAVEALVHEATHQHLYRVEARDGAFCDLDGARRFRSPWSGNRIPLHSLVHASFVYQALLALWSAFAHRSGEAATLAFARDRIARSLFGYRFLGDLLDAPTFPRAAVRADVLDAIRAIARHADDCGVAPDAARPFSAALAAVTIGARRERWLDDVRASPLASAA